MQAIMRHNGKLFNPAKAEEVAAGMNEVEYDDWTYEVCHDPKGTGLSFIKIIDEDGEYVGKV